MCEYSLGTYFERLSPEKFKIHPCIWASHITSLKMEIGSSLVV